MIFFCVEYLQAEGFWVALQASPTQTTMAEPVDTQTTTTMVEVRFHNDAACLLDDYGCTQSPVHHQSGSVHPTFEVVSNTRSLVEFYNAVGLVICEQSSSAIPCCAGAITNNNGASSGVPTTQAAPNTITNNNNNGGSAVVPPAAPGQTPAPGTYNVITTTTDCNGHVDVQYSYVPGLRGISRNNNNNCG
jgi:hypothetical protein